MTLQRGISSGAAAITAALLLAAPVTAAPPAAMSGSGVITSFVVTDVWTGGGNVHVDFVQTGIQSGTISGALVIEGHAVTHPSGVTNIRATAVVTGTTPCGEGTIPSITVGKAFGSLLEARAETVGTRDNTAGIAAKLDIVGIGATYTYSGTYHCH